MAAMPLVMFWEARLQPIPKRKEQAPPPAVAAKARRPRVYVSGPLTSSGVPEENVEIATEVQRDLVRHGFAPLNPMLTWYVDPEGRFPHDVWMDVDVPWVEVSDAVLRLPGESKGADIEVSAAEAAGVPVFTSLNGLIRHFWLRATGGLSGAN